MARPKTKSALVDGMGELVETMRNIESKLNLLIKNKILFGPKKGPGRPAGSFKVATTLPGTKRGPGRPAGTTKRGPGRPAGTTKKGPGRPAGTTKRGPGRPTSLVKKGPGRPAAANGSRGRGRPPGSKNK